MACSSPRAPVTRMKGISSLRSWTSARACIPVHPGRLWSERMMSHWASLSSASTSLKVPASPLCPSKLEESSLSSNSMSSGLCSMINARSGLRDIAGAPHRFLARIVVSARPFIHHQPIESQAFYDLAKFIEFHRLLDVTVDSQIIAFNEVPVLAGGSQDHNGDSSQCGITLDLAQDLHAMDLGQLEVQQDQMRMVARFPVRVGPPVEQIVERFFAVAGHVDLVGQVLSPQCVQSQLDVVQV